MFRRYRTIARRAGDLRIPFQRGPALSELFAALIIQNPPARRVGMLVDDGSDLVALGTGQIDAPRHAGSGLYRNYLTGVPMLGECSLILLAVERPMRATPVVSFKKRAARSAAANRGRAFSGRRRRTERAVAGLRRCRLGAEDRSAHGY